MKQITSYFILLLALMAGTSLQAQKSDAYALTIDGVKVIVKPSGNDIVVIQTIIKGGVQNYTADKAGIESLAITALTECGTQQDDKNTFKDKLDAVSAQVGGGTGTDYATFRLNCIKSDFETVWPLYTAAMLAPRFDEKEFARIKQDAVNVIRANESSPDNALQKMVRQTAFEGEKYAIDPQGTVESVNALTPDETKKYWESIFTRSRMVIVVVADLDKPVIEQMVKSFLAKVPPGKPFEMKRQSYHPNANSFKADKRENATNYVQGVTGGPSPGSPDYNAFVLAMRIFSNRHFIEIRTKNGLSYAPGAWFSSGTNNYSNIYVTTTEPDRYIAVARHLIDKIKQDGFTADELKNEKTGYLTGIYYRDETNNALAGSFAYNEVIQGDWKRAVDLNDEMKKVTLDQLNNAFRKYISNITWCYQGDPSKVNPVLYTQKETPAIPAEKKAF